MAASIPEDANRSRSLLDTSLLPPSAFTTTTTAVSTLAAASSSRQFASPILSRSSNSTPLDLCPLDLRFPRTLSSPTRMLLALIMCWTSDTCPTPRQHP
ncbi:Aspartate aminotransferase [Psidium guajava]|nr:Aspartate aminotransferase [Psidium guajava]KAI3437484.1 Aspartate aminotransferase [Psidium guajava]KAI3437486.1 Aspartate aminotransferase [Psidium guajava]KAI3437488.1 Aspartate aminotransferase [Psidium guajava]